MLGLKGKQLVEINNSNDNININEYDDYQKENESEKQFVVRMMVKKGIQLNFLDIPDEIKAIEFALSELDEAMIKNNLDPIEIKIVGGFAAYAFTDMSTKDIDSVMKIDHQIKELAEEIAYKTDLGLESDWLNDDVAYLQSFSDENTRKIIRYLQNHDEEFYTGCVNGYTYEKIVIKMLKAESLACMKAIAINSREKEKDKYDFQKIMQFNNLTAESIWKYMKRFGVKIEKEEFATICYFSGVFTGDDEYQKFLTS